MPNVNSQTIYQMGNVVNDIVKQATGRDAVQAIEMAHVTVEQNTLLGIETQSGSVVRFRTPKSVPLLTLEAQIVAQQNLNGYDYPWPAGGGKNMFDSSSMVVGYAISANGELVENAGYQYTSDYLPIKSDSVYTLQMNKLIINARNMIIAEYDENKTFLLREVYIESEAGTGVRSFTFTSDSSAKYVRISVPIYSSANNFQLEEGSTATAYAPYSNICPITGFTGCNITVSDGDTTEHVYPVEWETEAGTVYGGVLDAKNGKLTVKQASVTYDGSADEQWQLQSINSHGIASFYISQTHYPEKNLNTKCNMLRLQDSSISVTKTEGCFVHQLGNVIYIRVYSTRASTVEEFKTWLASNNLQIVYELAEPVEYDVTPVAINTLAGDNVISADTGDISLSYYVYSDLL